MQNKAERPRSRLRRPLFFGVLLIGAGVMSVWLFLANFDLDLYRDQISAELSKQLQLPVQFGRAQLVVREAGIACRLTDVAIGTPQTDRELTARTIWLQLAWRGVLLRQLLFSEIALDQPHLRIAFAAKQPAAPPTDQLVPANDWLDELRIHRFELRDGTVDLAWQESPGAKAKQLKLFAVTLDLDNLAKGNTALLDLSAQLRDDPGQPERLTLKGSAEMIAGNPLTVGAWEASLTGKEVSVAPLVALLPESLGVQASGAANLSLTLHGQGDTRATLEARLVGDQLRVRPGEGYQHAVPLRELQLAGEWQRTSAGHAFRQLAIQLDDARLSGELHVSANTNDREVHLALGVSSLPLATLTPWIPANLQQKSALFQGLQPAGLLQLDQAMVHARLAKEGGSVTSFRFERLLGEVRQVTWTLPGGTQIELVSLPVQLNDERWQIQGGEVKLASVPVQLSGIVTLPKSAPPTIALDLAARGASRQFATLWPHPLPEPLTLDGDLSWQAHVEGTPEELAVAVRADLSGLQIGYGEQLNLPATAGANWVGQGTLTPTGLRLARGDLLLPPLQAQFQGVIDWAKTPTLDFTGKLELDDLARLYPQVPALARFGLQGGLALDLAIQGPLTEPAYRGSFTLRDLEVPMHGIVADISALRGQLHFSGRRLQGEAVTALLGRSPVNLDVNIADLTKPHLDLKIRAAAARADELIFRSDSRMLRDLNGRLLIDSDGISFAPVHVRLDQGTRATIRGSVRNFAAPKVDLAISGDYANVAEIIALWTDESPAAKTARLARHADQPQKPLPPIRITVEAKHGDLYGMQFSEAKTLIVPSTGQLLLHPLDFKVGEGYCSTQVLINFRGEHPLLRVSGHAENVDAYQIHNELLDRKSIVRGTLRGDFYLQGELGATGSNRFLATSHGNFHLTVQDGVMRHSPVISTLFSILNVSQLFQMQLPDVSSEGVPFTLLNADLALDRGTMQSHRLVMESNALDMSYLGKFDMLNNQLDLLVVVKPLGAIDTVVAHLPVAGWILTGEERTLVTAQFEVTGPADAPKVEAIPISTLSKGVLGIIQRTLSLPYKLVTDPAILWGQGGKKQ